jgi:hypothetical protein
VNGNGTDTYNFYVSGDGTNFTEVKSVTSDPNWAPITSIGLCTSCPGIPADVVMPVFTNFVVAPIGGDANLDGKVNGLDYQALASNWLTGTTVAQGNFKGTGVTDGTDYQTLASNWLSSDPYTGTYGGIAGLTPEPVTMALLALGGLGLLRRRK